MMDSSPIYVFVSILCTTYTDVTYGVPYYYFKAIQDQVQEHNARLALGSCGSQDFWGLSEWPASINEHGAINHTQSRGG